MADLPRSGDVVWLSKGCGVPWSYLPPTLFRVIRVHDWPTWEGMAWIDGYQLNEHGEAVERRSVYVQVSGLRPGGIDPRTRNLPRRRNSRQAAVPRQRISSDALPASVPAKSVTRR